MFNPFASINAKQSYFGGYFKKHVIGKIWNLHYLVTDPSRILLEFADSSSGQKLTNFLLNDDNLEKNETLKI